MKRPILFRVETAAVATRAFTLVELLVSVAVLALMIAMVASLVNSASSVIAGSRKQMDSEGAARLVLDRIASDLTSMVKRRDVGSAFIKKTGNDSFFFYGEGPGSSTGVTGASPVSLIGYRINEDPLPANPENALPVLERLGRRVAWEGASDGMTFLARSGSATFAPESTLLGRWGTLVSGTSADFYRVLDKQVFRMEVCYLLKSGTYVSGTTSYTVAKTGYCELPTAAPNNLKPPAYDSGTGEVYGFPRDLAGVVVAIAVLDQSSQQRVTTSDMTSISNVLADFTSANPDPQAELPAQAWQSTIDGSSSSLLRQVRVYQRLIQLN